MHGGRAVLVGDAAGPFPIGQGFNAAMEAATVLDCCLGQYLEQCETAPSNLSDGGATYDAAWRPELDAVSWISEKTLFDNRLHTLRAKLTMRLGLNVIGQAKSSTTSYSQVRTDAKRFGPLWA